MGSERHGDMAFWVAMYASKECIRRTLSRVASLFLHVHFAMFLRKEKSVVDTLDEKIKQKSANRRREKMLELELVYLVGWDRSDSLNGTEFSTGIVSLDCGIDSGR